MVLSQNLLKLPYDDVGRSFQTRRRERAPQQEFDWFRRQGASENISFHLRKRATHKHFARDQVIVFFLQQLLKQLLKTYTDAMYGASGAWR